MNVAGNFFATLDEKLSGLEAENARLNAELTSVYGSKRWRYLSKVLDRLPRSGWKSRDEVPKVVPEAGKPREKHGFPVATGEADAVPEEPASRNFHQDRIDIINMKFFDFDGKTFMNGGAERYVYDLACLLKKNGKKPRILQVAHRPFTKTYRGIKVVGVAVKHTDWWHFDEASHAFNNACAGSELIIASPVELASEITVCPVIGINHGMSLDSPFDFAACPARDLLARYHTVFRALDRATITVCVDTNFPNWVQTFDYELRQKLRFIPNYYDEKAFRPTTKRFDKGLKFVFPRRVADYRGADITLTAFSDLLAAYPEISLAIIGQYHSKENEAAVKALIKRFPKQVSHREVAQDRMPAVYADADVALVPTKWSEGTSLSCIEAMANGCAVIATDVGGLPNLVLDGFNGLLIEPNAAALAAACRRLITNPAEAKKLGKNAATVAPAFKKSRWEAQWLEQVDAASKTNRPAPQSPPVTG